MRTRYRISPYRQQAPRVKRRTPLVMGSPQRCYRARQVQAGCCPHCGELCAPYYECATRRLYKRLQRRLGQAPGRIGHGLDEEGA